MITRIGFFHFVDNYSEPIEELKTALAEYSDIRDSLIVLPEAFNNGKDYYDLPRKQPKLGCNAALKQLASVSVGHRTAFVVGLLEPPHSSAYLIRSDGRCQLVCRKKADDGTNNYEPCKISCAGQNPIEHHDVSIGVLICNDIQLVHYAPEVASSLERARSSRKVFCVPAWMSHAYFSGDALSARYWPGKYVVLANANRHGCGSFITNTEGKKQCQFGGVGKADERCNKVVLKTFPEIDGGLSS